MGAQITTFGIQGVEEYCNYLKQVGNAQQIKNAIVNCFKSAKLPNLTDEERLQKLTFFVIVGVGPIGIEFAAELLDFIKVDGPQFYKDLLPFVQIKIMEAAHAPILRPFVDGMKEEAIRWLTRTIEIEGVPALQPVECMLNKQVSKVDKNIYFKDGEKIQYGMALWVTGIGPLPTTTSLIEFARDRTK